MKKNTNYIPEDYYNTCYYGEEMPKGKTITIPFFRGRKNVIDYFNIKNGGKFLDVACGNGWLLKAASDLGCKCYGVDFSEKAIELARKKVRATLFCKDINMGFPYFKNDQFDYVACMGSLEHFIDQEFVIKEIVRICKEKARIIFLVPNKDYILHKLGYETDEQPVVNRFGLDGWKKLLKINGCNVIRAIKENSHLEDLRETSNWIKLLLKLMIFPFIMFIPTRLSYNFIFICEPNKAKEKL